MFLITRFVIPFIATGILLSLVSICSGEEPDLSMEGSHEQFIKTVEDSQRVRFKNTVGIYDKYLAENPDDPVAATERCLFISYFVYSEDIYIQEAEELLEKAETYLNNFQQDPVVEIYRLDQLYGEKLIEKAEALLKRPKIKWSDAQLSDIHLKLASQYSQQPDLKKSGKHALQSLAAKPGAPAQLLAAEYYQSIEEENEGIAVLQTVYPDEQPYQKKQRMTLLSDLGASEEALVVLRELIEKNPDIIGALDSARIFAAGGLIKEARTEFEKAKENPISSVTVAGEYLKFEMQHGSGEQAMIAYTELRDQGFENDPFLYRRFLLLNKDPHLTWQFRDGLGLLALIALVVIPWLVPLLWLVPVHYWGLLRKRAGKIALDLRPDWNMRHAWSICGFFFFISVLMTYLFTYELIFDPLFDQYASEKVEIPNDKLATMLIVSDLVLLLGVGLIAGIKKSYLSFCQENWSWIKALGIAIICYLPLMILGKVLIEIAGMDEASGHLDVSVTVQSFQAVFERFGPMILVLSLAVITPIIEEVMFRGVLLTSLVRHIPFWAANLLQAGLFTLMHEEVHVFPFLFAFGLVTGQMRKLSGSVLASTFLHAINNGVVALGVIVNT